MYVLWAADCDDGQGLIRMHVDGGVDPVITSSASMVREVIANNAQNQRDDSCASATRRMSASSSPTAVPATVFNMIHSYCCSSADDGDDVLNFCGCCRQYHAGQRVMTDGPQASGDGQPGLWFHRCVCRTVAAAVYGTYQDIIYRLGIFEVCLFFFSFFIFCHPARR